MPEFGTFLYFPPVFCGLLTATAEQSKLCHHSPKILPHHPKVHCGSRREHQVAFAVIYPLVKSLKTSVRVGTGDAKITIVRNAAV